MRSMNKISRDNLMRSVVYHLPGSARELKPKDTTFSEFIGRLKSNDLDEIQVEIQF